MIIINILETIDTNYTDEDNYICSLEFVKSQDLTEMLLVGIGGKDTSELQIYVKKNDKNNSYILKNSLQFEDQNTYNSTMTTDKYMFVKAY